VKAGPSPRRRGSVSLQGIVLRCPRHPIEAAELVLACGADDVQQAPFARHVSGPAVLGSDWRRPTHVAVGSPDLRVAGANWRRGSERIRRVWSRMSRATAATIPTAPINIMRMNATRTPPTRIVSSTTPPS